MSFHAQKYYQKNHYFLGTLRGTSSRKLSDENISKFISLKKIT